MTTSEETQALRDTIATLRQRIADLESAQTLGAADRVILRALEVREMIRVQIGAATGMHADYVHTRLRLLAVMGRIESCGVAKRPKGSGLSPVLWRVKA